MALTEHQDLGGLNDRNSFLTALEPGIPRSGSQHGWVQVRDLFLVCSWVFFALCSHIRKQRKLWSFHMRTPFPSRGLPLHSVIQIQPLPKGATSKYPHIWDENCHTYTFGGGDTGIQSTAESFYAHPLAEVGRPAAERCRAELQLRPVLKAC